MSEATTALTILIFAIALGITGALTVYRWLTRGDRR